jgi:cGMP-dependent protein kinase
MPNIKNLEKKFNVYDTNGKKIEYLQNTNIIAKLGSGSYGRVFFVENNNEYYALKVLERYKKNIDISHRVKRETQIIENIKNNFIIKHYGTYNNHTNYFIFTEPCCGGDLFDLVMCENIKLNKKSIQFIAASIIEALKYLHLNNIAYRDLKLENIVLNSRGYLKLIDFGFSRILYTKTNTMCGTLSYLAPELIKKDFYNHKIDNWAFGVILYEIFTQKTPFFGKSQHCIFRKIKNIEYNKSNINDKYYLELIEGLLIYEPEKRTDFCDFEKFKYFSDFDFQYFRNLNMISPFIKYTSTKTNYFLDKHF